MLSRYDWRVSTSCGGGASERHVSQLSNVGDESCFGCVGRRNAQTSLAKIASISGQMKIQFCVRVCFTSRWENFDNYWEHDLIIQSRKRRSFLRIQCQDLWKSGEKALEINCDNIIIKSLLSIFFSFNIIWSVCEFSLFLW